MRFNPSQLRASTDYRVHNLNTGLNYTTIQQAIDAPETLDEHTIFVEVGIYYEHLVVNKRLHLIGENIETTVIDGNGSGSLVRINTGFTNITQFTIRNSGLETFDSGIWLDEFASNCMVAQNKIISNRCGIYVTDSARNNNITENVVAHNRDNGIELSSDNNSIVGNTITDSFCGIWFLSGHNSLVSQNCITNNHDGIFFSQSKNNTVKENLVNNTNMGIFLASSTDNLFEGNLLTYNNRSIEITIGSGNNTFYHNNFEGNVEQIRWDWISGVNSTNAWDNGVEGNYWSDYVGTDANHDGIGDTQYFIDVDNTDNYPLMGVFYEFNVTYFTPPVAPHICNVTVISNSSVSDFVAPIWIEHPEVIFLEFNVTGANGSTGFCRASFPTAMMNSTYHVFVNGTEVQYILLPCSDTNNSYLYFNYELSTKNTLKDRADINKDGIVDLRDAATLSHAWLSRPGDPNWKPEADLNNDSVIDNLDMNLLESVLYERTDIAEYQIMIIPEFPSFLALSLFIVATLLAVILYKIKRAKLSKTTSAF